MNSHKHLTLSQVLAPILKSRNLKVIWIPSCRESIQCKGNYSLSGLVHLQPALNSTILEAPASETILWFVNAVWLRGEKVSISLLHIKQVPRQTKDSLCLHKVISKHNHSVLDTENPSANNMISLERLSLLIKKKCWCFANIIQIASFVMDLTNHGDPTHY